MWFSLSGVIQERVIQERDIQERVKHCKFNVAFGGCMVLHDELWVDTDTLMHDMALDGQIGVQGTRGFSTNGACSPWRGCWTVQGFTSHESWQL